MIEDTTSILNWFTFLDESFVTEQRNLYRGSSKIHNQTTSSWKRQAYIAHTQKNLPNHIDFLNYRSCMASPLFPRVERLLDQQDRTGSIFSDPLQISDGQASAAIRSRIEKIQNI